MWLYLIIFAFPLIVYLNGGEVNRSKAFLVVYTIFLAFFVGLSDMFGGFDRYIYGEIFDGIADDITNGENVFQGNSFQFFEYGYSFLCYLIALVTENRYVFILTITLLIYFNLYKTFERHFKNYPFAYILFLGMTFFFTFTYLRQVVAFSFAWISIRFLLEHKKWQFFVMVALVALLHKSGIIFAGLWFMPIKKWEPQKIIMILVLCGLVGASGVTGAMYDAAMGSGLMVGQGNAYNAEGSARIAYMLEVAFFAWIILRNYERIEPNRENLIFLNMAWAFCLVLLLFVRSSDGGRVAWYFTMGIIYIISLVATKSNIKKGISYAARSSVAPLLVIVMLVLYLRIFNSWQVVMNLYPYKTFLTEGHRDGDPVFRDYEYDENYDQDKFYRPVFRFLKQ